MVVPCERSFDFFHLCYRYLYWDGVSLDYSEGIVKELVAIFNRHILQIYGIARAVYQSILEDVDAVLLETVDVDGVS